MCAACEADGIEEAQDWAAADRAELGEARRHIGRLEESIGGLERLLDAQEESYDLQISQLNDRNRSLSVRLQMANGWVESDAKMRGELEELVASAEFYGNGNLLLAAVQAILSKYGTIHLR